VFICLDTRRADPASRLSARMMAAGYPVGSVTPSNTLLSMGFTVDNIFNGRHLEFRRVFTGFRDRTPIAFREHHDELVGPLFTLSVKGNF
jgi:hypothetical protein